MRASQTTQPERKIMGDKSKDAVALTEEEGRQLYDHIRAIETLTAEKDDIQSDINERKKLCCEQLPVQKDVLDFVLKRRKHSRGVVGNFDSMLELVEEAIQKVEEERRSAGPAVTVRIVTTSEPDGGATAESDRETYEDDEEDDDTAPWDAQDVEPAY